MNDQPDDGTDFLEELRNNPEALKNVLYHIFSRIVPPETSVREVEELAERCVNQVTELSAMVDRQHWRIRR